MVHISEMTHSKYFKKEDFQKPQLFTISALRKEAVKDPETNTSEEKWVIYVEEKDQGLVLNKTNIYKLGELFGEEAETWVGCKIVMFNDPTVSFGNSRGGIRIRAPKTSPRAPLGTSLAQTPKPAPDMEDEEIPF
jgi:hypothetical protein